MFLRVSVILPIMLQKVLFFTHQLAESTNQAHNPEVSGSNPLPATKSKPESVGLWFFISPAHSGRHFS